MPAANNRTLLVLAVAAGFIAIGLFAFHAVSGEDKKPHSVTLTWKPSEGADSYNIYRSKVQGGPYVKIGSSKEALYVDSPVPGGATFYYVVTAVKNNLESKYSSEISAQVP
jgi:fibronectin type 3 domain-containing protein